MKEEGRKEEEEEQQQQQETVTEGTISKARSRTVAVTWSESDLNDLGHGE